MSMRLSLLAHRRIPASEAPVWRNLPNNISESAFYAQLATVKRVSYTIGICTLSDAVNNDVPYADLKNRAGSVVRANQASVRGAQVSITCKQKSTVTRVHVTEFQIHSVNVMIFH